jgi:hypothetical protein
MNLGLHPQPTAPWRPLIFRVHCIVTKRWMKIRVPYAWFWKGSKEYGDPEVESGTIADASPKPPSLPDHLESRLRDLEATADQLIRGPDTNRGGR